MSTYRMGDASDTENINPISRDSFLCMLSQHALGCGGEVGDKPLPSACPLRGGGGASAVPCRGCVPIIGVNEFWEDEVDIPGVVVWEVVIQITRLSPSG